MPMMIQSFSQMVILTLSEICQKQMIVRTMKQEILGGGLIFLLLTESVSGDVRSELKHEIS